MFAPELGHSSWLVIEPIPELNALPGMHVTLTNSGIVVSQEYPLRPQEVIIRNRARLRPVAGPVSGVPRVPDDVAAFTAVHVLRRKGPLALLA